MLARWLFGINMYECFNIVMDEEVYEISKLYEFFVRFRVLCEKSRVAMKVSVMEVATRGRISFSGIV